MRVGEIMTKGVRVAEPDEALVHAAKKMSSQNIGALPVIQNRELIGMITDRDIAIRAVGANKDAATVKVRDVMSEDCYWCSENENLEDAVRIMEQNRIRRLPVMNDKNEIVGMLSLEDVARHAPASLTGQVLKAVASRKDELPAI